MIISKTFKADIAHIVITQILPMNFRCKCKNLHGHTIHITAELKGSINDKTRMIIDYTLLKPFKDFIDTFIDHKFIAPLHMENEFDIFVQAFNSFYKKYGNCITWKDTQDGLQYKHDNRVFAKIKSTMSFLDTPSTTAEDMCCFLNDVLQATLKHTIKQYKLNDLVESETISTRIRFSETVGSEAISPWKPLMTK